MKLKVLKSKKSKFPSYYTPVKIVVVGEEDKGAQPKTLNVYFSKVADKKLPVDFKGGIIECNAQDVYAPFVYEVKPNKDDKNKKDYPFVYVKDIISVSDLKISHSNTCTFMVDEEETEETIVDDAEGEQLDSIDLPDDDLPF